MIDSFDVRAGTLTSLSRGFRHCNTIITSMDTPNPSDLLLSENPKCFIAHYDVIKWKHFPSYWPFVRGIHRSLVNSPHKGQWRGALMFSLICAWIKGWVNNCEAGDLRRHRAHYYVTIMSISMTGFWETRRCTWIQCTRRCTWIYRLHSGGVFILQYVCWRFHIAWVNCPESISK